MKHDLEVISCMKLDGTMSDDDFMPENYKNLDRFEARDQIVNELSELGFLVSADDHVIQLPKGDRSKSILEPMITDQWFVKTKELADRGIAEVENENMKFIPKIGRKLILSGCTTYKIGVFLDKFGGVIRFRHGMTRMETSM